MTEEEKGAQVRKIVAEFAGEYWQELRRRVGQFVPGADGNLPLDIWHENVLERCLEPQEWLTMARYGAGLNDEEAEYIYEICQGVAEWLFSIPGSSAYSIPDFFADTPFGALWWSAYIRLTGDELITISEAAELVGVTVQAISSRVDRGTLKSYTDPLAAARQGRRLVKKSDVAQR